MGKERPKNNPPSLPYHDSSAGHSKKYTIALYETQCKRLDRVLEGRGYVISYVSFGRISGKAHNAVC